MIEVVAHQDLVGALLRRRLGQLGRFHVFCSFFCLSAVA
jgi:hypothetical protein